MKRIHITGLTLALASASSIASAQMAFNFSTGAPNGLMAMASRPDAGGKSEVEAADDFILSQTTTLTSATFTGLLPTALSASDVKSVTVEIYRVFPLDSNTVRTIKVPTRANSPSDVEFASRSSTDFTLSFNTTLLTPSFTASNSAGPVGINASPNQTTGGNGPVSGSEFQFNVSFSDALTLSADHYFFIPQVELTNGDFFWLSGQRPTSPSFAPDLQTWIRDESLSPDWLRVGTDIVGGATPPTFNGAFSLTGVTGSPVPEPGTYGLLGATALAGLVLLRRQKKKRCDGN